MKIYIKIALIKNNFLKNGLFKAICHNKVEVIEYLIREYRFNPYEIHLVRGQLFYNNFQFITLDKFIYFIEKIRINIAGVFDTIYLNASLYDTTYCIYYNLLLLDNIKIKKLLKINKKLNLLTL